ncbi:MAG: DUF4064 domain-containing protein [Salinivirgaceae bacterium]|nr:DUF4064 domain-containing protein [Salinivirgaceae bacterium]
MGLFSKKDVTKTKEYGYVSFTGDDMDESRQKHEANTKSYKLLEAALNVSSHVAKKLEKGKTVVNMNDSYPCSAEECDQMEELLNQAKAEIQDDSDTFLRNSIDEMLDIVAWSREKHWTFKWPLILGCVISIFLLNYCHNSSKEDVAKAQTKYDQVKNWAEQDTSIAWDVCETQEIDWKIEDRDAKIYKVAKLRNYKRWYMQNEQELNDQIEHKDTAVTQEGKKRVENYIADRKEYMEKYRQEYDKINKMSFKEIHDEALKEKQRWLDDKKGSSRWILFYFIFCIVLMPLYIWTSRQPGYYTTRHRTQEKVLGWIQRIGLSIAVGLFGAGLAMRFLPDVVVKTTYSDGSTSTHTEMNDSNMIIMIMKIGLIIVGVILYCFVSLLIMFIATFTAIKRQVAWKNLATSAVASISKSVSKSGEPKE